MGDFDAIEVLGAAREQTLAEIRKQIACWGLVLPAVAPLPLHFGLNKFAETGETEFWIANETGHGYCGKFLFVFDGQSCPYHRHRVKHETFFVLKGIIKVKAGEDERLMREGDSLTVPPGLGHSFTGVGPALVLELSMPSVPGDSYFDEPRIGVNGVI